MFQVGTKVGHKRLRMKGEIVSLNERRALVRVERDGQRNVLAWAVADLRKLRAA